MKKKGDIDDYIRRHVNAGAIIAGAILGIMFKGKTPKRFSESIMKSMALGILNAIKVENVILLLMSLSIGTLIGEYIHIEKNLKI